MGREALLATRSSVGRLSSLPDNVLWGNLDTYGNTSPIRSKFLHSNCIVWAGIAVDVQSLGAGSMEIRHVDKLCQIGALLYWCRHMPTPDCRAWRRTLVRHKN